MLRYKTTIVASFVLLLLSGGMVFAQQNPGTGYVPGGGVTTSSGSTGSAGSGQNPSTGYVPGGGVTGSTGTTIPGGSGLNPNSGQQINSNIAALTGDTGGIVPCSGRDCGTCEVIVLGNRVIFFIVGIMIAIAILMLAIAGFRLVTSGGNKGDYDSAKGTLQSVLIGIIIILASWLIVDTIMKGLLSTVGSSGPNPQGWVYNLGPWNQVQCSSQLALTDTVGYVPGTSEWMNVPRVTATGYNQTAMTPAQLQQLALGAYDPNSPYAQQLCQIATAQGIGQYCTILQAQMYQESSYNPNAVSPAGAAGIFQIMPGTARQLCSQTGLCDTSGMSDSQVRQLMTSNPTLNMQLGVEYFNQGLQVTGGNIDNTLAYYNGGPRALNQSSTCPGQLWWQCAANSGYSETRNYVDNILGTNNYAP